MRSSSLMADLDYDPLIPIQLGRRDRAPLYCVPGAGANIAYFRPLAEKLGADKTVYGLQPRGLDGETAPHDRVEDMAQCYLDAIPRRLDDQPLRLIGHSFGAWVALEMAARWRAAGRPVAPLILLDSDAPYLPEDPPRRCDQLRAMVRLVEILEMSCEASLGFAPAVAHDLSPHARLELLRSRMVALKLVSSRTPLSSIAAMFRVFSSNLNTFYSPAHPYPGAVTMIRASHELEFARSAQDAMASWLPHAPHIVLRDGPGNHMTMLAERHAAPLAEIITDSWTGS